MLDTAVRDKAIAHNPAHAARRPKVTANEAAYMTPDQVRTLLASAEGSRYAPLFALLVNSGLRRGEAPALHWSDIDLEAGHVSPDVSREALTRLSDALS